MSTLDPRGLPADYHLREQLETTPRATRRLLDDPEANPLLIDVRTADEHRRASIKGAVLIPLHELERRVDEVQDELEANPQRPVIVHCHHGMRSLRAASFLQAKGIGQARSMAGGIDLWSIDIDPMRAEEQAGSDRPTAESCATQASTTCVSSTVGTTGGSGKATRSRRRRASPCRCPSSARTSRSART